MSKKRVFDIDFPDETPAAVPAPDSGQIRRGPMAAAISENAGALQERAALEQAIRDENDRLAHEHVRMKREGLIIDLIALGDIRTDKLQRDRRSARDDEIEELKSSIKAIGLSNAIRVEVLENGYQLIQGYRRLTAYRELFDETGEDRFARIPAGLVAQGDALEKLYRRMVDENLVRRDISFAEMAILASRYAADPATSADSVLEAVTTLYGSAGRQKRNYIAHFASLMERIGADLRWPEAIPRALGLDLEKRLSSDQSAVQALEDMIRASKPETADAELQLLRDFLEGLPQPKQIARKRRPKAGARTTLRVAHGGTIVKCVASEGRLELKSEKDYSAVDRATLENALNAFLDAIQPD